MDVPAGRLDVNQHTNRLLTAFGDTDFALLAPHLRNVPLLKGSVLQEQEAPVERVYFPLSGIISLLSVMEGGEMVETAMVGREGAIGAFAGPERWNAFTRAVVQSPGLAAVIPVARFQAAAAQSDHIRDLILRYKELQLAQIQQAAACNALHLLEARLARWLLQMSDRADGPELPLTQDVIAQTLAVRRSTITVIASRLQGAGSISYHRGRIVVVDRSALENIACECYSTMRRQADAVFDRRAIERAVERQYTGERSLAESLEVLVNTAIERAGGKVRAAFYLADASGNALHHIIGMTPAYARCVDGFAISPESLACGLAAATRQAIITPDVTAEPRWKPWLWLAKEFDYRACWSFPIEAQSGKIVGTLAMYHKQPTNAQPSDLGFAAALTRTAATIFAGREMTVRVLGKGGPRIVRA